MKKLFIAAFFAIASLSSFAAPVNKSVATRNFRFDFKRAVNVTWSQTGDFLKASFNMDGQKLEAFYNPDGERIGTTRAISLDELPVNAKRKFAQKMEGYTVKEAIRFEGNDESAYFISGVKDNKTVIVKVLDSGTVTNFVPANN